MKSTITRLTYDGAIFYSKEDLSLGWNLKKAAESIPALCSKVPPYDINEILEMYNILKLFDTNIRIPDWTDAYYDSLQNDIRSYHSIIGRYVHSFDYSRFIEIYQSVCVSYIRSFWDMFEHYNMQTNMPSSVFVDFLNCKDSRLSDILTHKKIVEQFDALITDNMITNNRGAELLIDAYLVMHNNDANRYHFPSSLSRDDKTQIIETYVNSANPNPNHLDMIVKGKKCSDLNLSDKLRLVAQKKYNDFWNEHFTNNSGIKMGATVSFKPISEPFIANIDDPFNSEFTFDSIWISGNLDYPTLLNNFIYLFGFVDFQYRSQFPAKGTYNDTFESLLGLKSKGAYPSSQTYNFLEMISLLKMRAYDMELNTHSIRVEDLIKWFFEEYLQNEFNADGFYYNASSSNSSYVEKTRHLCSELDCILKQFDLYVENCEVDRELIMMSSSTPLFSQIRSFQNKKYGYLTDVELKNIAALFFSTQSTLAYTERTKENYDTFFDLIRSEKTNHGDFFEYQQPLINELIKLGFLNYAEDMTITYSKEKLHVLKDFYDNEVICLTYNDSPYIHDLITSGKIVVEGTLFSRPEQDYLDYMLNDHTFDNGLKIRNNYIHGSNPTDSNQQTQDYYQLLRVLVTVVLKINEEFCRREDTWNIQK